MSEQNLDLVHEQERLDVVYARLDEMRETARNRLAAIRRAGPSGSPQNRSERDSFATLYEDRIALLEAVEDRLVFGRLDFDEGSERYIGRIGLNDTEQVSLLTDWRAPAAQPFYRATSANRDSVKRRRHLVTQMRKVTGVEDEILDLTLPQSEVEELNLSGEGALLASLSAGRTGKMHDIVATIQAEQDEIIRAPLNGALVVQGGPGTGKTAVALHRAAYLLYAHRRVLERSGVLLVGPSSSFLRYIDQVLPSLGETGVVSTTLASLLPDITATATDDPAVQRLKGDPRFATFIKRAVKARERVPSADQTVRIDGHDLVIRRRDIRDAMFRARRTNKPHNLARKTFVKDMLSKLAAQYVADMPYEVAPEDRSEIIDEIRLNREVRVALNIAWFPITPMKLVEDLFAKPHRLAQAAPELTASERALLAREAGSPWTDSDIPILDEAFEMLGEDDSAAHAEAQRAQKAHAQALEYARQVLESSGGDSIVGADVLAGRFVDSGPTLTTAERASRDRTWTYAHVIVDEAQELSPMAWRMLVRRCPTRSFTIVGDVAQTSNPAGATSWSRMLAPIFRDQRQIRELTINYRTPSTIADAAIAFARANSLPVSPLTSARDAADSLRYVPTDRTTIVENMTQQITDDIGAFVAAGTGRVAVVAPQELLTELEAALPAQLREQLTGPDPIVSLVTPVQAKGLEYDAVIVGLPNEIVRSINGVSDLFVAMTRATQRLTMFHTTGLPAGL